MLKGDDKQLYDYTMKMMENITSHYLKTDFDKGTDVNKLIEHGVARKIAAIMPDKYTEVEVTVAEVNRNLYVTATYSIDGEAEIVAIHKEEFGSTYAYDPQSNNKDFFFGNPTARSKLDKLLNEKGSLGVSCRGVDSKALKAKEYPQYDENGNYDPRCVVEDFGFSQNGEGRGSKVETLPGGQGLGQVDEDINYFRSKLMTGLKRTMNRPYTTERFVAAKKAEDKPTVDFSTISQISMPTSIEIPRYETGMHVGIDLATVDVEDQRINTMAKEVSAKIDKQILEDIMNAAKAIDMSENIWAVPTFGWTEEKTEWNKSDDITWATSYGSSLGYMQTHSPFGGVLTTDNTAPVWYNPYSSMEEISFTEDELDELIELINTSESKVMEFA